MKYLLLIYSDESLWSEDEMQASMAEAVAFCQDLAAKGQYVDASPLHPVATATSVRSRGGTRNVTDGPFAETKEQLGGYVLIDVPSLDEAIEVAGAFPCGGRGTVEIRPLFALPGMPKPASSSGSSLDDMTLRIGS